MDYEISFNMIMHAGNAKSSAMLAIEAAESKDFKEADRLIIEAEDEYNEGHRSHKQLLDQIMVEGKSAEIDLLLAHALDHLTSAEIIILMAKKFIHLYRKED